MPDLVKKIIRSRRPSQQDKAVVGAFAAGGLWATLTAANSGYVIKPRCPCCGGLG